MRSRVSVEPVYVVSRRQKLLPVESLGHSIETGTPFSWNSNSVGSLSFVERALVWTKDRLMSKDAVFIFHLFLLFLLFLLLLVVVIVMMLMMLRSSMKSAFRAVL